MEWIADPAIWASFVTLAALEIVLGIDNLVFIALLAGRLPPGQRDRARKLGLALALGTRLVLLGSIFWMVHLTYPVLSLFGHDFSWRDLILIGGGGFLLYKAHGRSICGSMARRRARRPADPRQASPAPWCRSCSSISCSRSTA
jgi:predicted tellurium resistance membrane protein TerC